MRSLLLVVCACLFFGGMSFGDKHGSREKEWAFLIFLNGNNNLYEYSDLNINQLETIGSTDDIDVIVQWAKFGVNDTYRLRVEKDSDDKKVTSPFIETLPRVDMGDYKKLVEFVEWSVKRFPAKRYFISFWNHGSGWHRKQSGAARDISFDDYSNNKITTEQMGLAMREISKIMGKKVDIVGADACLMAMAEVGGEMADSVKYFVASEETEPALGWPYHTFYERWAKNPKASSSEISGYLVEEYFKYLSGQMDITLSALDLTKLSDLSSSLNILGKAVLKLPMDKQLAIKAAASSVQSFYYPDYVDLGHLIKRVKDVAASDIGTSLMEQMELAVSEVVVANAVTPKYQNAKGVSIWYPRSQAELTTYKNRYSALQFTKASGWDAVLESLIDLPACVPHVNGQWATEVIGFSSEYGTALWSAKQTTGQCNVETYGDNLNAWAPKEQDKGVEFISVGFVTSVNATGVVIRETLGSGFVTKVEAIDINGTYHDVWAGDDSSTAGSVSDLTLTWPATRYLVKGLKLTINTAKNKGWEEIDSIQMLGK